MGHPRRCACARSVSCAVAHCATRSLKCVFDRLRGFLVSSTRTSQAAGSNGKRFTLTEPWTLLLLDDTRVIHESTPILPTAEGGYRDTLVLTYRAGGFQEEGG